MGAYGADAERHKRPPLGGSWHGKAVAGGESVTSQQQEGLTRSLPQSASLTAPSSEGALRAPMAPARSAIKGPLWEGAGTAKP